MRLTPPTPLDPKNAHIDAYDLAHTVISLPHSSQLVDLRWGKVKDPDMIKYLTATYATQISQDIKIARIGAALKDGRGDEIERREHLVIRDFDLLPLLVQDTPEDFKDNPEVATLGRIVAHADWWMRPKGWSWHVAKLQANSTSKGFDEPPSPEGANVELIKLFDTGVEELLDHHCEERACYELVTISTNATHLRKGLAKQLTTWVFPYCDEQQLDCKLLASPMGRGLYRSCGFVEEGEGDRAALRIDMGEWGASGVHEHVYMVRHPKKPLMV